jgi:hypothetical protein
MQFFSYRDQANWQTYQSEHFNVKFADLVPYFLFSIELTLNKVELIHIQLNTTLQALYLFLDQSEPLVEWLKNFWDELAQFCL